MHANNQGYTPILREGRCAPCPRKRLCFGRQLGEADLAGVTVSSRLLHRGDHLFFSGQVCDMVCIIKSGHVKTVMVSEDGQEQITGFYGPGQLLGADGLARKVHAVDAIALDTVSVCMLRTEGLLNGHHAPALPQLLINKFSEIIVGGEQLLLTLGKLDAEQRLAAFLLEQSRSQARAGCSPTKFTLPMSRGDIANHLNLAVETVSRLFTRFRQRGLIRFARNEVHWLDVERLGRVGDDGGESRLRVDGRRALPQVANFRQLYSA